MSREPTEHAYNSVFRADDDAPVNDQVWGMNTWCAPVRHLRRNDSGGMFDTYAEGFHAVGKTAGPVEG
ncbi:hypothetical protein [Streptomyces violascens]|uniref:hypothetical protein n=1 Tax=Streptomyces violascens TaxID=67381 RepID=UPI0016775C35|nr:hypothetical protein [Streptomyces violascens]